MSGMRGVRPIDWHLSQELAPGISVTEASPTFLPGTRKQGEESISGMHTSLASTISN